jgi:hypothetical protein
MSDITFSKHAATGTTGQQSTTIRLLPLSKLTVALVVFRLSFIW